MRVAGGGRLRGQEPAAWRGLQAPTHAARLAAAAERASRALLEFDADLARWHDSGSEQFAIGEEAFNFLLRYQHALRDTAPELWRYGLRLKEEIEADLVRLAKRLDGKPWPEPVDKPRADHPAPTQSVDADGRG